MTMKLVAVAALFLVAMVMAAPQQDAAMGTAGVPVKDPFLQLIKEIEASDFFLQMTPQDRLLTFEMLTASETNHLKEFLDRIGYIQLFSYIVVLPMDYQRQFIAFSIDHLKKETPDFAETYDEVL